MGDTSSKLGLYFAGGGSSGTHGADEIADVDSAVNDNLKKLEDAIGLQLVTSTSRPSNPYLGMPILETDTGKGFVWSGLTWLQILDLNQINGFGGTTAARDAYWGNPGTGTSVGEVTARATLANKGAVWFNTEKGYQERYYAKVGDTGALDANVAFAPGWYPSGAGVVPEVSVCFKPGSNVAFGVGFTVITTNDTFAQEMKKPIGGATYGKLDGTAPGLRLTPGIDGEWEVFAHLVTSAPNFNLAIKKDSVTADYGGLVAVDSSGAGTGTGLSAANISKVVRLSATNFLIVGWHCATAGSVSNSFEENFIFGARWKGVRTR